MTAIFDAMIEMRAKAVGEGANPRRWEINQAGKAALMLDDRARRKSMTEGLGEAFLGIPMTRLAEHWHDDDPKVRLIVDESAQEQAQ